jgi:hypothetical protein
MKLLKYFLFLLPPLALTSCAPASQEAIAGAWSVDTISTRGESVTSCFLSNVLDFKSDGSCALLKTLPEDCPLLKAKTEYGNWNFDEHTTQLIINSPNAFFNKKYRVHFVDDTLRRMLVMRLTTPEDTIICRKGLYEYDKQTVQSLVNLNAH